MIELKYFQLPDFTNSMKRTAVGRFDRSLNLEIRVLVSMRARMGRDHDRGEFSCLNDKTTYRDPSIA